MTIAQLFNPSTWCCCKFFIESHKKCISILGAATFLLFPFGYCIYRVFKSPNEPNELNESHKHNENILDNDKNPKDIMKSTVNSFPIIYNRDKTINILTIKKIYYCTIIFCQEDLISIRRKILILRRKFFFDIEKYIELTLFLYNEYYQILETSLRNILSIRHIERKTFENSVLINEKEELLRRGFLRDAAWSILSEKMGNSNKITREKLKEYIIMQIKDLKLQKKICDKHFQRKDRNIKLIILSNRADDLAFERLGIQDLDYVKSLKNYLYDEEIKRLIEERNSLLIH